MTFLCIYCNTVYFPLFHTNTRGGNRLTRDMICATYTVTAVSGPLVKCGFADLRTCGFSNVLNADGLADFFCGRDG